MKAEIDYIRLFETDIGKKIYDNVIRAVNSYSMNKMLSGGVLLGLSGGADSVMLLCVLLKYRESNPMNIVAVHINHMIRGEEADRDESFSRELCKRLGVEFRSERINVPALASLNSKGIEEMARNVRYSKFREIIKSRSDVSSIAVAHNSNDNLETLIFNMMRGSGTKGLTGISPVRDEICRPLIFVTKKDIIKALDSSGIPYVTDSTNFQTEYRRNYIRSEIIPKLAVLTDAPERQAEKLCFSLRADNSFIEDCASEFISNFNLEDGIPVAELKKIHPAVFSRVLISMQRKLSNISPEYIHIEKVRELIMSNGREPFMISMPDALKFICDGEKCFIRSECIQEENFDIALEYGINPLPNGLGAILISTEPINKFSSNVYKISTQVSIDFDIIVGKLSVRNRRDGDTYVYGNMTRKLKKIFNDKKIPPLKRSRIPIICDEAGIICPLGFPIRDGGNKKNTKRIYIALLSQ